MLILNKRHLRQLLAEHVTYFNRWRPHRSVGQRSPCAQAPPSHGSNQKEVEIIAKSVLGVLHGVYDLATMPHAWTITEQRMGLILGTAPTTAIEMPICGVN